MNRKKEPAYLGGHRKILPNFINYVRLLSFFGFNFLNPIILRSHIHLKRFGGKFAGKRCYIMGNGPSLSKTPLERLDGEIVWGLNRCYLLFNEISWRPRFVVAVDNLVVPDIADEINEEVKKNPGSTFFFPSEFLMRRVLKTSCNIIWFIQRAMEPELGPAGYFSEKPYVFLRTPYTVTITAIQLAVFFGFNPIYLIGCDTAYKIPASVERKKSVVDPTTRKRIGGFEIRSRLDNDPNHFSSSYFGAGSRWHYPNVESMFSGYQMVKMACDRLGVKIYNATAGGKLEVFPRMDFSKSLQA